jgi:hypothetical protein
LHSCDHEEGQDTDHHGADSSADRFTNSWARTRNLP